MEKMEMKTKDIASENVEKIGEMFPNCVTETKDENGNLKKAIDFEALKQELSHDVLEGDEVYDFTWVGKKASMVEANTPTNKTLRPCKEDSVNWDTTENLYIEGDNLEVLKIFQESYLGKVKMIYIDPPYNTGNDFVYRDNFKQSKEVYDEDSGEVDEEGNRLFRNTDSNGRFHSDWCSMMYSRLKLAKNLLSEDGVIFISIDDNEQTNCRYICDSVFGNNNCLGVIANTNNPKGRSDDKFVATAHEYLFVYAKDISSVVWYGFEPTDKIINRYNKIDSDGKKFREIDLRKTGENDLREDRPNLFYYFYYSKKTGDFFPSNDDYYDDEYIRVKPMREDGKEGNWRWGIETAKKRIDELLVKFMPARKVWGVMQKDYLESRKYIKPTSSWAFKDVNSERGTEDFINLGFDKKIFLKPKPLGTIKRCLKLSTCNKDIILDFFSGSATTAHAVMQLNAEDGGKRKYIMVQLPEECDEKSEAYKAGYKNICEIGKERIRRAAKKIHEGNPESKFDDGFRDFKLDSSNMKDVYYSTDEYSKSLLDELESNIKEDRTDLDLLFGCLLDWGAPINKQYESEDIDGCKVHFYDETSLVACFDENVSDVCIKEIAKRKPLRVVFRDSSFKDSPAKINVEEIFKMLSPKTSVKVI